MKPNRPLSLMLFVLVALLAISGGVLSAQELTLPPDDLRVIVNEGSAAPVLVEIDVVLPDGCARIGEVSQTIDGNVVTVNIEETSVGDPFTACTQAIVPVTVVEAIDLTGLDAGEYTVEVASLSATFTLTNELLDAALCYIQPEADDADRDEAEPMLMPVVNVAGGYCLHLPEDYAAEQTNTTTVIIPADAERSEEGEEVESLLVIESADVTAADFEPVEVDADTGERVELANVDGLLLDELSGYEGERFLYIETDLTQIVAADFSGDDALWDAVLARFTVFDPYTIEDGMMSEGQPAP